MPELVLRRGATVAFEDMPDNSLALDGYVQGPDVDLVRRRFSFDHHDRCLRLVTRATCQQVMDALLLGFDSEGLTVYINDVDGDTALALWLLENPARVGERRVRELVESVGGIDAHGPAYPALNPDLADSFFREAMAPEHALRRTGEYSTCDLEPLLRECVQGIQDLVDEKESAHEPEPPPVYEVKRTGTNGWAMIEAEGFVFGTLYAAGFTRLITQRVVEAGGWQYTVAKKSDLVPGFPVGPPSVPGTILGALAAAEPGWGGGSSIGGSPRNEDGTSSRLSPDEVFQIVEGLLSAGSSK